MTFHVKGSKGEFIVVSRQSKIGYAYPMLFVHDKDGFANVDVTIGAVFKMSEDDFNSWLDGTEIESFDDEFINYHTGLHIAILKQLRQEIDAKTEARKIKMKEYGQFTREILAPFNRAKRN